MRLNQNLFAFMGSTACTLRKCHHHSRPHSNLLAFGLGSSLHRHSPPLSSSSSFNLLGASSVPLQLQSINRSGRQSCCRLYMDSSSRDNGGDRSGRGGRGGRGRNNNNRRRTGGRGRPRHGRQRSPPPPMPPPGQPGRECFRSCIIIGADVHVIKKEHQRTGRATKGTVSRLLTKSAYHPRGIKVMMVDGEVGRVTKVFEVENDGVGAAEVEAAARRSGEVENNVLKKKISLSDYLKTEGVSIDLSRVLKAVADASAQVAIELRHLSLMDDTVEQGGNTNVQGEEQKSMDIRANEIFIQQLKSTVAAMVSEEEEGIIDGDATKYRVAFDPLDGSSNLDVSAPTGSIFGIYCHENGRGNPLDLPARKSMVAAGYTLYSSATDLVLAGLGDGVVGFTLDDEDNTFRRSRPEMVCPERGPYYSLNEAREPDWPDGLRQWINDAKRGETPSGIKYSARYVCSLTADVHRTLIKGGWAGNPRPHLRLLYEAAPLAFIMEAAGGAGSDGVGNLLDIEPTGLHDRVCCFLGSKLDVEDLEYYGNVQQKSKTYKT